MASSVLPSNFLFYLILIIQNSREVYTLMYEEPKPIPAMDMDLAGGDILFMVFSSIIYTILIFVVEILKNKQGLKSFFSRYFF